MRCLQHLSKTAEERAIGDLGVAYLVEDLEKSNHLSKSDWHHDLGDCALSFDSERTNDNAFIVFLTVLVRDAESELGIQRILLHVPWHAHPRSLRPQHDGRSIQPSPVAEANLLRARRPLWRRV